MENYNDSLECRIKLYEMSIYIQNLEYELQEKKRIIKRLRKKAFYKRMEMPT